MSSYSFNYSFNITGNCDVVVQGISQNVEKLNDNIRKSVGLWDSFEGKLLALNQFTQYVEGVGRTMQETLQPGAALNASLADLSAISGETGESLRRIEGYARETAKTFGGSAAQSVESYKLLLSQLSPELPKYPDALRAMGDNIAILSKTMGGDATAAAEVLTTAMNQYGVSLADPMEAARRMAGMMNVMAAAARRVPPSSRPSRWPSSNAAWRPKVPECRSRRPTLRSRCSTRPERKAPRAALRCATS